ncbi:MAG TPA: hypothetical protein DHW71_10445 [Gammaproteobacteria bacterium]|nr:hypothetical protein [Gammaproteobacteria bacterium]MEC8010721.1 hypothetical protein [Pseudomonadota bacterium]HBF08450.1 hypothetical protein [Gammaproteobacteria bacterium]HCK93399.1 hypothetical protein [Gammaproteobacteria bacterium]|tara:strand:- start:619 stop:1719 length:1101 start_codon:yes stop_codon:yes gene_type:complete
MRLKAPHFILLAPLFISQTLLVTQSYANDIQWSGFASVTGGMLLGNGDTNVNYPYVVERESNSTYDDDFSLLPETLVGLQAIGTVNEKTSLTAQIIGKSAAAEFGDSYELDLEWLYLTYYATPDTAINLGRFRIPLYYYSDFIHASYAYHWVRAPMPVYSANLYRVTGINIFDSRYIGEWGLTTQAWYGSEEYNLAIDTDYDMKKNIGFTTTLEYDVFHIRAVYAEFSGNAIFRDSVNGDYTTKAQGNYQGIAFMVDTPTYIWHSEINRSSSLYDGIKDTARSGYTSIGYKYKNLLPHYTYTKLTTGDDSTTVKANTFGIRWDVHKDTAVKFEYTRYTEDNSLYAALNLPTQHTMESITAAIDLVF